MLDVRHKQKGYEAILRVGELNDRSYYSTQFWLEERNEATQFIRQFVKLNEAENRKRLPEAQQFMHPNKLATKSRSYPFSGEHYSSWSTPSSLPPAHPPSFGGSNPFVNRIHQKAGLSTVPSSNAPNFSTGGAPPGSAAGGGTGPATAAATTGGVDLLANNAPPPRVGVSVAYPPLSRPGRASSIPPESTNAMGITSGGAGGGATPASVGTAATGGTGAAGTANLSTAGGVYGSGGMSHSIGQSAPPPGGVGAGGVGGSTGVPFGYGRGGIRTSIPMNPPPPLSQNDN